MKNAKLVVMTLGLVLLVSLALFAPLAAVSYYSGAPGDISSLAVFSPGLQAQFTCAWAEGNLAILVTESGRRRLVDAGRPLQIGTRYKLARGPQFKFCGGRHYLTQVS